MLLRESLRSKKNTLFQLSLRYSKREICLHKIKSQLRQKGINFTFLHSLFFSFLPLLNGILQKLSIQTFKPFNYFFLFVLLLFWLQLLKNIERFGKAIWVGIYMGLAQVFSHQVESDKVILFWFSKVFGISNFAFKLRLLNSFEITVVLGFHQEM